MMRSLSSAVSGLRAHQTRMDVVGNNIANVNTFGFKASRATFSDIFYQNIGPASRPTGLSGGTNPTQIGYGASIATIDVMNTQSGMSATDRAMDVYINGDGMIAVRDANNNILFTRLGILGFDAAGNLVDGNGNFVLGVRMDPATGQPMTQPDGSVLPANLGPIQVDPELLSEMVGVSIGPRGEIVGMMPGEPSLSLAAGAPGWIENMFVPPNSDLVGAITVEVAVDRSVTSGNITSSWVRSVQGANGMEGDFTFFYDQSTQQIIAQGRDPITNEIIEFRGAYRRGSDVQLRLNGTGEIGFTVSTHFTLTPGQGGETEQIGELSFETQGMLVISGTDAGGNRITAERPFETATAADRAALAGQEIRIEELGNLTIIIANPLPDEFMNDTPRREFQGITFDGTAPNAWLNGTVTYRGPLQGINGVQLSLEKRTAISNINPNNFSFINSFDRAQFDTMIDAIRVGGDRLTPGADTELRVVENPGGSGTFQVQIWQENSAGVMTQVAASAAGLAPGANIDINGVTIGTVAPGTTATTAPHYRLTVAEHREVVAQDQAGNELGRSRFNGTTVPPITGPGGLNISIPADAAALSAAFATLDTTPVTGVSVGSVVQTPVSNWPLEPSDLAHVQAGPTETVTIGFIAIGRVPNMAAMEQFGNSYFIPSANSGDASFFRPGFGQTGTLRSGFLEMSNVDISKEFTEMIVTQRGFQANTRIITVSDEMLQELVNLKR